MLPSFWADEGFRLKYIVSLPVSFDLFKRGISHFLGGKEGLGWDREGTRSVWTSQEEIGVSWKFSHFRVQSIKSAFQVWLFPFYNIFLVYNLVALQSPVSCSPSLCWFLTELKYFSYILSKNLTPIEKNHIYQAILGALSETFEEFSGWNIEVKFRIFVLFLLCFNFLWLCAVIIQSTSIISGSF